MWGWNPAEMRDGTNSDFFVKLARQNGARVVCIDPRMSLSAVSLADEWIAIRPGTDTAMMSAMAYVMMTENLYDAEFVRTHCVGFDQSQMPPGAEGLESYSDYLLGTFGRQSPRRRNGPRRSPPCRRRRSPASPANTPRSSRRCCTRATGCSAAPTASRWCAPAACWRPSPATWASPAVGPAGWRCRPRMAGRSGTSFPPDENPVKASIPVFLWTEAVLRGKEMTAADGVIGAERLDNDIKLIYAVASNALINQHADINRTARILQDESLVEFIAVQDNFLTPTGRFADLLLPACTQFETWGVEDGWKYGDEVILMPKLVEPPGETQERLPHLRRDRRTAGHRRAVHRGPR